MRQLFGTDGIRGRADQYPLDDATMVALGQVLAVRLRSTTPEPRILLGMDTRQSGTRIARALATGIVRGGGVAELIGVIPTPGIAYLCRLSDAVAGISISASHNPYEDNGVKVFGHDGMKVPDRVELELEREMEAARDESVVIDAEELPRSEHRIQEYEQFLIRSGEGTLDGLRVVLDAGHGAAFRIAPEVFRAAGADVSVIHDAPDGRNINLDAGALHPEILAKKVVELGADVGVAFDGDADRAIFVDDKGVIRDGDEVLYLWGTRQKRAGALPGNAIVATVMSNFGFESQLQAEGIRLLRANVGDKYVLEMMQATGSVLGGEQSGHIIDLRVHTTGDGIHTALEIARLLRREHAPFSALSTFLKMPQVLLNERVASKPPLESLQGYVSAVGEAQKRLASRGRILVRYSGTENLVRVMVEGENADEINEIAASLAGVLREEIARANPATTTPLLRNES